MKQSFLFNLLTALCFLCFCVHPITAQQLLNKTLNHDGELREYTIYIPASYQGNSPVPLLFNFHGGNGDIASQIAISDMRPIADSAAFILVYPQALADPNDDGSTNWTHKAPTTVDDIFFVEAMIDALATEYVIDESRVYACGYSNGGEFSFELACRLSHRIAAIGVVARSMYIETLNNCNPSHPIGIVSIHGTNDAYNGITFAGITYYIAIDDMNNYWSNYNNTDATPIITELPNTNTSDGSTVEHHSWQNGDACVAVEHYKVIGGGHDWPGTFGNMDIDASLAIWNYVSQYNLNGLIACTSTAIENSNKENEIFIYPNPVENYIRVEMDSKDHPNYQIYTATGKLVRMGTIRSDNEIIDLSGLPPNLYFLKIGSTNLKFGTLTNPVLKSILKIN